MKSSFCLAALATTGLLAGGSALACNSLVGGEVARVCIIDRDTGAQLTAHRYRGDYWVAGTPGARYAIEIRNLIPQRVLAVTSVDGVNVISGETAGWDQTGYVFNPGEQYRITGWRKSDAQVAAFTFTDSSQSYAERTGRPANIGIIGVALFRERPPAPVIPVPEINEPTAEPQSSGAFNSDRRTESPAPAARAQAAPKLGTGHGEREASYVNHTDFDRLQSQPNEVIRIHYDSLENLIAMGIVKRPWRAPSNPNPFPASSEQQYAPDPPG